KKRKKKFKGPARGKGEGINEHADRSEAMAKEQEEHEQKSGHWDREERSGDYDRASKAIAERNEHLKNRGAKMSILSATFSHDDELADDEEWDDEEQDADDASTKNSKGKDDAPPVDQFAGDDTAGMADEEAGDVSFEELIPHL